MPGQPPALVRSVQDLEFVACTEAQVLCGTSLVIKKSHEVVPMASLRLRWPGRLRGTAGPRILNHHWLVCLLGPAGEKGPQVRPEPHTDTAHGAPAGSRGEDVPLPTGWTDPLSSSTKQLPDQLQLTMLCRAERVPFRILPADLGLARTEAAALEQNQEGTGQEVQWEGTSSWLLRYPTINKIKGGLFKQSSENKEQPPLPLSQEKVSKRLILIPCKTSRPGLLQLLSPCCKPAAALAPLSPELSFLLMNNQAVEVIAFNILSWTDCNNSSLLPGFFLSDLKGTPGPALPLPPPTPRVNQPPHQGARLLK